MNKITGTLALSDFGIITTEFGIIGILPDITEAFDIKADKAGLLVGLFALVAAVFGPILTLIMSRFDGKRILQASTMIFIASNVISALAGSFGILLFARILPAFLLPVHFSNGLVIAAESVPKEKAMQSVTMVYAGLSVATVLGIPTVTYVADFYSWETSFWMKGILNIIALLGVSYVIPSGHKSHKPSYRTQMSVLKKKSLWLNISTVCLMGTGAFTVYSYFAVYLETIFGMNGSRISMMLLLFGITGLLGNWYAGITLSKNVYRSMLTYIVSMGIILVLLGYIGKNLLLQAGIIGLWGFFHTAGFVVCQVWISMVTPEAPEFGNSIVVSTGNLGIFFGAALGGFIISHFGLPHVVWGGAFLCCFALALVVLGRIDQ